MTNNKLKIALLPLLFLAIIACEDILFEEDLSEKAVTIIAPVNNTIIETTTVNFNWDPVNGSDEYQIQIATPTFSNAVQVLVDSIVTENITQVNFNLEAGQFEWRIKGLNNSSQTPYTTSNFSIEPETFDNDLSEVAVHLIAPANDAVMTDQEITFSWEAVPFSENYKIQIATPDFENATQLLADEVLSSTSFSNTLEDGAYQWRVKAQNSESETSYTTYSLTVMSEVPFPDREVVILSPDDSFITNESLVSLQWEAVNDATLYRIQIIDAEDQTLVDGQTTTQIALVVTFTDGDFIWQVRAENNTEATSYTSQTITVDTVVPNAPSLLTPVDGSTLTSTDVTFTWTRDPIDGSTEKDYLFVYFDSNLTNLAFSQEVTNGSFTTLLDDDTTYYWLMNAVDEAGNESDDSDVYSFTINE